MFNSRASEQIVLDQFETVIHGDVVRVSAMIHLPDGFEQVIWYEFPSESSSKLTKRADPFVAALIFLAMREKLDMVIKGTVSAKLLDNLDTFQAIWHHWYPKRYAHVNIVADAEVHPPSVHNGLTVMPFSGGLDSSFALFENTSKLIGRRSKKLDLLIMIHGLDIPVDQEKIFELAFDRSNMIAEAYNVRLISVKTNIRDIQRARRISWENSFISYPSSVILFFSDVFEFGLLAGDTSYSQSMIWGSNQLSNGYFSNGAMDIQTNGGEYTRLEKSEFLSSDKVVMENLRVCWQGDNKSKNCGRCEKCHRTYLEFKVNGVDAGHLFESMPDVKDFLGLAMDYFHSYEYFKEIFKQNKITHNLDKNWEKAIQHKLNIMKKEHLNEPSPLEKILKRLKKFSSPK